MTSINLLRTKPGSPGHDGKAHHALTVDWSTQLGWFRFHLDDDRWVWSPQVERMHGYKPQTTAPTTLLLLSHVHLDDYQRVAATIYDAQRARHSFSSHHRIVDTRHQVHDVVLVGAPFHDTDGATLGMHGLFLDATPLTHASPSRMENRRHRVRAATQC